MSIVNIPGRSYVLPRSYEFLQAYLADFANVLPEDLASDIAPMVYYADIDQLNWMFGPYITGGSYTMECQYYATIQPLNSGTQINYWTIMAPRILIFAAMVEAARFIRSDDRAMQWEQTYAQELAGLTKQDKDNFVDNSIVRA
jgi:hypothetical protein